MAQKEGSPEGRRQTQCATFEDVADRGRKPCGGKNAVVQDHTPQRATQRAQGGAPKFPEWSEVFSFRMVKFKKTKYEFQAIDVAKTPTGRSQRQKFRRVLRPGWQHVQAMTLPTGVVPNPPSAEIVDPAAAHSPQMQEDVPARKRGKTLRALAQAIEDGEENNWGSGAEIICKSPSGSPVFGGDNSRATINRMTTIDGVVVKSALRGGGYSAVDLPRSQREKPTDSPVAISNNHPVTFGHSSTTPSPKAIGNVGKSETKTKDTSFRNYCRGNRNLTTMQKNSENCQKQVNADNSRPGPGSRFEEDEHTDDESKNFLKNSILQRLSHTRTKHVRLRRLTICRLQKDDHRDAWKDRVWKHAEVELAQESFARYFGSNTSGPFNKESIIEALADFGIQGATRAAKRVLNDILVQHEEVSGITFTAFCAIIEEARGRMRQLHSFGVFQTWRMVDLEDVGALPVEDIMRLFTTLNLSASHLPPDQKFIEDVVGEMEKDEDGLIVFHALEYSVELVRQHEKSVARRLEREIQERYDIDDETFRELRPTLLPFYSNFVNLDEDHSGALDKEEVQELLAEFGFERNDAEGRKKQEVMLAELNEQAEGDGMSFPVFLDVVRRLRMLDMESKEEDVRDLFRSFDVDRSGTLDIREVCQILEKMGLQPRTVQEQEEIAQLMDDVDRDGSGELSVLELLEMAQRLGERLVQINRQKETKDAEALGFSKPKVTSLRHCFKALDTRGCGSLGMVEVERALAMLSIRMTQSSLQRMFAEIDEDESGQVEFPEFMRLMRRIEEESAGPRKTPEAGMKLQLQ